jgi:BASS family bile acid:Na+ symporter
MLDELERTLLVTLFVLLMFGMGARLSLSDFRMLLRTPRAFIVGTLSQFGWMPLCAFGLAKLLALPPPAAIGLVVLGSCPAGATSNLFAHLARADVALSVSMTASSKLLGMVMMPLCLYLYARPFTGQTIAIPYVEVVGTLFVLGLPVLIAMLLRQRLGERFARGAARIGSVCGGTALVLLILVGLVRNGDRFLAISPSMYVAAVSFGALGMGLGALAAWLVGLPVAQLRTVSFESGVPNPPLCLAILLGSFGDQADVDMIALPLLCQLFTLIEASLLVLWFRMLDTQRGTASRQF